MGRVQIVPKLTCYFCGKKNYKNTLHYHLYKHTKEKWFQCDVCKMSFSAKLSLKFHELKHNPIEFNCKYCAKTYLHPAGLMSHIKKLHIKECVYHCSLCSLKFKSKAILNKHKKTCYSKGKLQCYFCSKTFDYPHILNEHLAIHTTEKTFKCDLCHQTFRQESKLKRHRKIIHLGLEKSYKCQICPKAFKTSEYLQFHIKNVHNERTFACDICGMPFRSSSNFTRHYKSHSSEHKVNCPFCNISLKTASSLKTHLLSIHTKECYFKCYFCDEGFSMHNKLAHHIQNHTKEKYHKCRFCNKNFSTSTYWKVHEKQCGSDKSVVNLKKDSTFACDICRKTFQTAKVYKQHCKTHSSDYKVNCPLCNKVLANALSLKNHLLRIHTKESYFKCYFCDQGFSMRYKLTAHMTCHTKEKYYKCCFCNKRLCKSSQLKLHAKKCGSRNVVFYKKCSQRLWQSLNLLPPLPEL